MKKPRRRAARRRAAVPRSSRRSRRVGLGVRPAARQPQRRRRRMRRNSNPERAARLLRGAGEARAAARRAAPAGGRAGSGGAAPRRSRRGLPAPSAAPAARDVRVEEARVANGTLQRPSSAARSRRCAKPCRIAWLITLDNGQMWRQTYAEAYPLRIRPNACEIYARRPLAAAIELAAVGMNGVHSGRAGALTRATPSRDAGAER